MKINENQKVTLTIGQLKKLIKESIDSDFEIKDGVLVKYHGEGGEVVIPDSVTDIGWRAFQNCSGLTSVTIPDSVTSIEYHAFEDCSGLASVTIPDSVTSIETGAFWGCSGLTSVTIGNGVTSIGGMAFYYCRGLTSVTIPDSVTSIGPYAFDNCTNLKSVTIGNGVKSIGSKAFCDCTSLVSITIPDSVERIEEDAFAGCPCEKSISIPKDEEEKYDTDHIEISDDEEYPWSDIEDFGERYAAASEELEQDDLWDQFLSEPEGNVNDRLKVFPEPSTQGGMGSIVIFDEAEPQRWDPVEVDFDEWTSKEYDMATSSHSEDEYAKKYETYLKSLIPAFRRKRK